MSIFSKIFRGTVANDKTGDPLREGGQIINDNFDIAEANINRIDQDVLNRVSRVDSVQNIAGLVGDYDGQQISLLGWHPDSDIGGGVLYWDSSRAKSDHDGGTVFSPTVPWSIVVGDYLDGIGETDGAGTGVWVRADVDYVAPEIFGANADESSDSAAIKAAIAYTSSLNQFLDLDSRRYFWDGSVISDSPLRVRGKSMPDVNAGMTALENGSIIQGTFGFTSHDADLRDFGVDVGVDSGVVDGDGIRGTAPLDAGGKLHTENLVALNKTPSTAYHALLFQSYQSHTGTNIFGYYSFFGFVSKCKNVDLGLVKSYFNDESGVLLKSDTGFGRCENVSIDRIVAECSANQRRGFHIQSSDAPLRHAHINSIKSEGAIDNVLIQVGSSGVDIRNIRIESILSRGSQVNDLLVDNLNGLGAIFNVSIGNIIAENTTQHGIRVIGNGDTESFEVESAFISYAPEASDSTMDGSCLMGLNCKSSVIKSLTICRNYGFGYVGGITYNNDKTYNVLGSRRANVFGLGAPESGFSNPALSGASATLVIEESKSGENSSTAKVTLGANTTITSFEIPNTSASNFERGHRLNVINNSVFVLTVNHNPAGGIFNLGSDALGLQPNECRVWIYGGGGVWHQAG